MPNTPDRLIVIFLVVISIIISLADYIINPYFKLTLMLSLLCCASAIAYFLHRK